MFRAAFDDSQTYIVAVFDTKGWKREERSVGKYAERKNGIDPRSRMRLEIVTNESLMCLPCLGVKDAGSFVRRSRRVFRHHGEGANFRHSEAR